MLIDHQELRNLAETIFGHAGSAPGEAEILAGHLIESNLMGHDSHGVIRIAPYLEWLAAGQVKANRHARVASDFGALLGVEGGGGYGLVIAGEAMALAIEKARTEGAAVLALRDCSHLGRIGAWAEQAAEAGFVSLHFVNTSGFGIHVAPFGGSDRRLSANPIAAGIPVPDRPPIILDIATSIVAAGKIQVARNKGKGDTIFANHVVHNVAHNLVDGHGNYYRETWGWLEEGVGHYYERRENPRHNHFCWSEGKPPANFLKPDWEGVIFGVVRRGGRRQWRELRTHRRRVGPHGTAGDAVPGGPAAAR